MDKVKVKFEIAHEIAQCDRYTGQMIERDKATETHVTFGGQIEMRGLSQGFAIKGFVAQPRFGAEPLAKKIRAAVIAGIAKNAVHDVFRPTEFPVDVDGPEMEAYDGESMIDTNIADSLEKQARIGNKAVEDWRGAIAEINTNLGSIYQEERSKVRSAFGFFESCNSASWQNIMYLWCEEKLSRIRHGINNLDKRKNSNHITYRSIVNEIHGHLRNWPVINTWRQHPPKRY